MSRTILRARSFCSGGSCRAVRWVPFNPGHRNIHIVILNPRFLPVEDLTQRVLPPMSPCGPPVAGHRALFSFAPRNFFAFFPPIVAFSLTISLCEVYSYFWSDFSLMSASSELEPHPSCSWMGERCHSLVLSGGGEGTAWPVPFSVSITRALARFLSRAQGGPSVGGLTAG